MISMANNTSMIPVRKILHILSCWHDCSPGREYTFNRIFTFAFFRSSVNSSFMTAQMSCPNSTVTIFFTVSVKKTAYSSYNKKRIWPVTSDSHFSSFIGHSGSLEKVPYKVNGPGKAVGAWKCQLSILAITRFANLYNWNNGWKLL